MAPAGRSLPSTGGRAGPPMARRRVRTIRTIGRRDHQRAAGFGDVHDRSLCRAGMDRDDASGDRWGPSPRPFGPAPRARGPARGRQRTAGRGSRGVPRSRVLDRRDHGELPATSQDRRPTDRDPVRRCWADGPGPSTRSRRDRWGRGGGPWSPLRRGPRVDPLGRGAGGHGDLGPPRRVRYPAREPSLRSDVVRCAAGGRPPGPGRASARPGASRRDLRAIDRSDARERVRPAQGVRAAPPRAPGSSVRTDRPLLGASPRLRARADRTVVPRGPGMGLARGSGLAEHGQGVRGQVRSGARISAAADDHVLAEGPSPGGQRDPTPTGAHRWARREPDDAGAPPAVADVRSGRAAQKSSIRRWGGDGGAVAGPGTGTGASGTTGPDVSSSARAR
jgi:hypothetical protein